MSFYRLVMWVFKLVITAQSCTNIMWIDKVDLNWLLCLIAKINGLGFGKNQGGSCNVSPERSILMNFRPLIFI